MLLIDFLKYLIEFFQSITHSYGLAIILTSLLISTILMPFIWVAEKLQKKEIDKKTKMKYFLDEFKYLKNKREKFHYTQEVYRKFNYNPLKSLIGFLGLLIQVPFFIAIYWLLLDYNEIQSVSFGVLNDLSKPDNLITIGNLKVNFLPFLMTLANLMSLFIASLNSNEKRNLLVISLLFLILLYNLPSSLLLYWTFNNIFSVFKTWIFKKIENSNFEILLKNKLIKTVKKINEFKNKNWIHIMIIIVSLVPFYSFYVSNLDQLPEKLNNFYLLAFFVIPASLIISNSFYYIFKNKDKAYIISFLTIICFFTFGHFQDYSAQLFLFSQYRYSVIFTFLFLGSIYVFVLILIFRLKRNFSPISKNLTSFTLIFILILFCRTIIFNFESQKFENNVKDYNKENQTDLDSPDIYYIVLDGYASSTILKSNFQYDNSYFENFLLKNNFKVINNSKSNYAATFLSLSSVLNMTHLNILEDKVGSKDRSVPYQMIKNNKVLRYLKKKGYDSYHFDSNWGPTIYNENFDYNFSKPTIFDEFSSAFMNTTLFSPLIRVQKRKLYRSNVLNTFEKLPNLSETKNPKFVFAHILPPHSPYVFDKNGNEVDKSIMINNNWSENDKQLYLDQLIFVTKKIKVVIDNILNNSTNSVIIIQSDHGPSFLGNWDNPSNDFMRERLLNLNAIKVPNKYKSKLTEPESIVNTFPSVFNAIFNDSIDKIEDKVYFSSYSDPYNFKEIPISILDDKD